MRIITHGPHHAFFNMAIDEAISEAVRQKLSPPTLRLYQWDRPSLSIGYFQKISEIDDDYCNQKGYPVVRRATGGRAVFHDQELTYSFSSPKDFSLFGSLFDNYSNISRALVRGLNVIGIEAKMSLERKRNASRRDQACFRSVSYGEITVDGKKVVGSAQKRYQNGFLQQGSIMPDLNAGELNKVLRSVNEEDLRDIGLSNSCERKITFENMRDSLKEAFEEELNVKLISDKLSKFEQALAGELEANKYSTRGWNFQR